MQDKGELNAQALAKPDYEKKTMPAEPEYPQLGPLIAELAVSRAEMLRRDGETS